ncbi:MAG: histidine triad nucleotide-binding protein [Desulfobulbaceae bacterium]|nr:histidine triad nucleotide-binding protein [Desulfobulbaceae bacterium]
MNDCIFCKIVSGEIPANKLYEDDEILAFLDMHPQAPTHFLVIPKKHIKGPADMGAEDITLIGKLVKKGADLAHENGIGSNFRLVMNNGAGAGQTVFHIHLHVLGGRAMNWPPG